MLSFAEEIFLLALDDEAGTLRPISGLALGEALVGAVLMDLALMNRIDTDPKILRVVDGAPTGDAFLDAFLHKMQQAAGPHPISHWLAVLSGQAGRIQESVLSHLIGKGILKQENRKILWVFEVRRYPMINNREYKEVKSRLRELILSDDLPDPRDAVLISLVNACRLFDVIFTAQELEKVRPRINQLSKLDLIGQEVARAVREIERAMVLPMML